MTASTVLLSGVDKHGAGYRRRMRFGAHRHTETRSDRRRGERPRDGAEGDAQRRAVLPTQAPRELTLQEAAEALLARKRTAVSRKTKRPLGRAGSRGELATAPGARVSSPGCRCPCSASIGSRMRSSTALRKRPRRPRRAGRAEGDPALRGAARRRRRRFDQRLLTMERIQVASRQRVALSVDELDLLVARARVRASDAPVRRDDRHAIGELFSLDGRASTSPGGPCSCRRRLSRRADKVIDLTFEEVAILRETCSPGRGTSLVFPERPSATGRPWRHFQFLRLRLVQGPLSVRRPRPGVTSRACRRTPRRRSPASEPHDPARDGGDDDARRRVLEGAGGCGLGHADWGSSARPHLRRRRPAGPDAESDRRARPAGTAGCSPSRLRNRP